MEKSNAHAEIENALPTEDRAAFNELVDAYRASSEAHTGKDWVNRKNPCHSMSRPCS